jgi:hypothetical protein
MFIKMRTNTFLCWKGQRASRRFAVGDKIFDAEAGTMVTLPKNIPHAWGNRSDSRLRIAGICYPGGVEETMRIIAEGGVTDIPALAERFGVIVLGPAPF